jgi:hypothetical protein
LVVIGDISATRTEVIVAGGSSPLRDTVWTAHDRVVTHARTPAWAVVLTVVFFPLCLLGLLFLLIKRPRVSGWVEVTVNGPGVFHTTRVPVDSAETLGAVHDQLDYARTLVTAARQEAPAQPTQRPGMPASSPDRHGPNVTFNDSRSHWFDGTSWRDARLEIPPDAEVDRDQHTWWDGSTWRPLP